MQLLRKLLSEVITVKRLDGSSPRNTNKLNTKRNFVDPQSNSGVDDMPYFYPTDEEPEFDFGDNPLPDDENEYDFGDDFNDEDGGEPYEDGGNGDITQNGTLDNTPQSSNLNTTSLNSSSASTPSGGQLNKDLAQAETGYNETPDENSDENSTEQLANTAMEDPNKQGVLRNVKGTRLVYKRKTEDGTYEELWIYNIVRNSTPESFKKRRAILAGTDIPPNKDTSPDGSQTYDIWTTTNAELIRIRGLQN